MLCIIKEDLIFNQPRKKPGLFYSNTTVVVFYNSIRTFSYTIYNEIMIIIMRPFLPRPLP